MNLYTRLKLRYSNPYERALIFKANGIRMGEHCQVFSNVSFGSEPYLINIGDYVEITSGVSFITHDGGIYVLRNLKLLENADYLGRISIGNNVFIGNSCIILPNVTIGDNCVIGAGSIVSRSIPPNSVAVGVPARVIKSIDEYYTKYKNLVDNTTKMNSIDKEKYLRGKYNIK